MTREDLYRTPNAHRLAVIPTIGEQVDATVMSTSTTVMDLSGDVSGAVFYDGSTEEVTTKRIETSHRCVRAVVYTGVRPHGTAEANGAHCVHDIVRLAGRCAELMRELCRDSSAAWYISSCHHRPFVLRLLLNVFRQCRWHHQQGLLDFAFSPMFDTNSYFYVSYNVNDTVSGP